MNTYPHIHLPRTYRRVSAAAIAHLAATRPQAARLAAFDDQATPAFWDHHLIDRLHAPVSRIRE